MSSLSATLSKHSLYENLLPTYVGPTLTVSDLSQTAKFGKVRSYEENLTFTDFAFVSFHPMIVHPITVHPMIQKSFEFPKLEIFFFF